MTHFRIFPIVAALTVMGAVPSQAQDSLAAPRQDSVPPPLQAPSATTGPLLLNEIVAVVGHRPILMSDVEEVINVQRSRGIQLPTDSAAQQALRHQVVEQLVDEELLYQQALEDSVIVEDSDVRAQVDETVQRAQAQLGTEEQLRTALRNEGLGTLEDWRRMLLEQAKRSEYQRQLLQKLRQEERLPPVPVTDAEVEAAFAENAAARPRKPAQVSFRQIIIAPKPAEDARVRARVRAESLLVEIRGGADFAMVAKRESMDGTRDVGGDLGWTRRGATVPEFDRWLFALGPGQMSPVIETPFGFHIIRVDRVQPAEVKARHILIVPELDSADAARAMQSADSVAQALRAGANLDSLAAMYHDPAEQALINDWPIDSLPATYQQALRDQPANTITDPFPIENVRTSLPKYVVARIISASEGGEYTVDDVRTLYRQQLSEERSIRRYIDGLRKSTFVSIRI